MTEEEWIHKYDTIGDVPQVKAAMAALKQCVPLLESARIEMQSLTGILRKWISEGEISSLNECTDSDSADMDFHKIIKLIDKLSIKYDG
jgi:hypothetical protein